jgi:uncharacterized membrane protein
MRFHRFRPYHLQIAIVLLAAILNFTGIDRTPLWNDEGFSFFAAQSGMAHTLRFIADDTHPPLYYLTLSLWLNLGTSVFVIRALSAAAMTLTLLPLHAAARRLFDERVALMAGFLFAVAPLGLSWAQKARPYPLQVLLVACAFWGFVRVWRGGHRRIGAGVRDAFRQRTLRPAAIDLGWFAYAFCGALAMLTQEPAGFFLLGCNVTMVLSILRDFRRNRILLSNWIIAQFVLVLIWMSWLPTFLHQLAEHLTAAHIASRHPVFLVRFVDVLDILQTLFGIAGLWRLALVFVPIYMALACFGIVVIVRRRRGAWPLLGVITVPIVTCVAGFFLVHPIFGYVIYTFIWMLVPYTILIAAAIMSLRPMLFRCGVLAIVLSGNVWALKNVYQIDTPPLDRIAAVIRANREPGDGIVLSEAVSGPPGRWAIAYYLGPPFGTLPGLDVNDWGSDRMIHSLSQTNGLQRVWVVLLDGEAAAVDPDALRSSRRQAFTARIGAYQIMRFE